MPNETPDRDPAPHARLLSRLSLAVCGVLLLTAVVVNQSAAHWRGNIVDDHLFAYYGWCVAQGARPYLDIWDNKPPGIWWLNAAAFKVCGPGVGAEVLLGSLAVIGSLVAFVGIARTVYPRSLLLPAALAGIALLANLEFECGGNRTETYVVACATLAMFGYVRWLHTRRPANLLVAGLLAGAAPLFKQSGLAVTLACGLHLAWTQWCLRRHAGADSRRPRIWRPWATACVGWVIPPLAAALALAAQGALGEALFAVGRFNVAYFAVGDASWLRIDRALAVYRPVLAVLAPILAIATIGLLADIGLRLRGDTSRSDWLRRGYGGLFLMWFLMAAYLACVGPGRRGHHFMPALPALGLLALHPLHLLAGGRGLGARLTARPVLAVVLVVWGYCILSVAAGGLREAERIWRSKPSWWAAYRLQPAPYQQQAADVVRRTKPSDTVYVWGWSPGTYRWAYRRPASRFATLEKCGQVGHHADFILTGAMADLRRAPPAVFVISPADHERLAGTVGRFGAWLNAHYTHVETVAGMRILARCLDRSAGGR